MEKAAIKPSKSPENSRFHDGSQHAMEGNSLAPPTFQLKASSPAGVAQMEPGKDDQFNFGKNDPKSLRVCLDPSQLGEPELKKEIFQLKTWLSINKISLKRAEMKKALKDMEAEQTFRATYDDVTKKAHNQSGLNGAKGEMVRTMLQKAGFNPRKWYQEMVSINLFGQEAKGIRPEFAAKLKAAEKLTLAKLAKEDPRLSDPRMAKKYLGINESYKTSRRLRGEKKEYQSMHLFGLAIDINYGNNPWITQDGRASHKPFYKKLLSSTDALFNSNTRAAYTYTSSNTKVADQERLGKIFDGHSVADKQLELYFSLLDNDEKLKSYLEASESRKWKTISVRRAKSIIKKDYKAFAKQSSRNRNTREKANFKKEAIMDLDKRFVMSMGEVGLDWGGKYGDMMHFDMRFTGIGKKIQAVKYNGSVRRLKARLKRERAARRAAE